MPKLRPYLLILMLGMIPALAGCGDLLDLDINTDPDAATEISGDLLMPTALVAIGSNRTIELGTTTNWFANMWASDNSAGAVFLSNERYNISSFTAGNTWFSFYNTVLKNLLLMREDALEATPARPNVAAQAEILASYVFWMLTAVWGEIPFTEALQPAEFPQPAFDDQETVLRELLVKLDDAIALIDRSPSALPGVGFGDMIYEGDMDQWERFANSLKLRILMMIRNKDTSVDSEIAALLDRPLIRSNADNAEIPYFQEASNANHWWKLQSQFGGFIDEIDGNWYFKAGATIVNLMDARDDPRLDTYFAPPVDYGTCGDPGGCQYLTTEHSGQLPGATAGSNFSTIHQNFMRPDFPSRIATAAETYLFEAEFLAATGAYGDAQTAMETGIELSMDWFNGKPGAIPQAEQDAYLDALPDLTAANALEMIWEQQYVEVFERGPENWVHIKRTHYPLIPVPVQAVLSTIIRRYPYPPDEVSSNPNTPAMGVGYTAEPMWFEPNTPISP
jgi:hypothetical protein